MRIPNCFKCCFKSKDPEEDFQPSGKGYTKIGDPEERQKYGALLQKPQENGQSQTGAANPNLPSANLGDIAGKV